MWRRALMLLVSVLLAAAISLAADVKLFVHNKPYKGKLEVIGNSIYVELEPLLKLLRVKYVQDGGTYYISTSEAITPVNKPESIVYVNGEPFTAVFIKGNSIMIDVKSLSKVLGYKFMYNPDTGIADVLKVRRVLPQRAAEALLKRAKERAEESESSSSTEQGESSKESASTKEGKRGTKDTGKRLTAETKEEVKKELEVPQDAIKLINEHEYYDFNSKQLIYSAEVVNTWKRPVKAVTVTLMVVDGYGKPIKREVKSFGTLKPGEKRKIELLWFNYTGVYRVSVKYDINFQGKKKTPSKAKK